MVPGPERLTVLTREPQTGRLREIGVVSFPKGCQDRLWGKKTTGCGRHVANGQSHRVWKVEAEKWAGIDEGPEWGHQIVTGFELGLFLSGLTPGRLGAGDKANFSVLFVL